MNCERTDRISNRHLLPETFYERMADISRIEREISKLFSEVYEAKHKERDELYARALDDIKGTSGLGERRG